MKLLIVCKCNIIWRIIFVSSLNVLMILVFSFYDISNAQSAFPGAEGFGSSTPGGRGGRIFKVTNLNKSGPGSLRAAIEASGPRVVVFEVSGTIQNDGWLYITNPYLTIAGQTAPSPGITLRGATVIVRTHDVIIQHLRFRVGDQGGVKANVRDNIMLGKAISSDSPVYNVVIDHCSFSWSIDGSVDIKGAQDVTVSNCIISESLYDSIHPAGPHSFPSITDHDGYYGQIATNISFIKNLWAHSDHRNPKIHANESVVVNNVSYNIMDITPIVLQCSKYSEYCIEQKITVIGNVDVEGGLDGKTGTKKILNVSTRVLDDTVVYLEDNICEDYVSSPWDCLHNPTGKSLIKKTFPSKKPVWPESGITVLPSSDTVPYVLNNAGSRPADRDDVDLRVINSVKNKSGRIINSQNDVGGWPILKENYRALSLPPNPNKDDDNDGYTNLEEWIFNFSREVELDSLGIAPPQGLKIVMH